MRANIACCVIFIVLFGYLMVAFVQAWDAQCDALERRAQAIVKALD